MNWKAIGNLLGSALAAAAGQFVTAKQTGAADESAGISAGYAFVVAIVQQLRSAPTLK